jgi:HPt (histidine-containing phosphotransfer) domain-containing protein
MDTPRIDDTVLNRLRDSMFQDQFKRLLELFAIDLADRLAALYRAMAPLDRGRIAAEAHKIVGSAADMGAHRLAEAARRIEHTAADAMPETITADIAALLDLAGETQAELDRLTGAEG